MCFFTNYCQFQFLSIKQKRPMIFFYLRIQSNNASIHPMRLKGQPQCCKVIIKSNLLHCLWRCKSIVPVLLFVVGFLLSIRNNNRRILNVKMSSEVGNIVLGKNCQKKRKSEIRRFFLSSNFWIFTKWRQFKILTKKDFNQMYSTKQ